MAGNRIISQLSTYSGYVDPKDLFITATQGTPIKNKQLSFYDGGPSGHNLLSSIQKAGNFVSTTGSEQIHGEKLFRDDYKYNYIITINYNTNKIKLGKGSAIFLHLTKNYKPTAGCIGLSENDFLIILKLISKKTKIKIL